MGCVYSNRCSASGEGSSTAVNNDSHERQFFHVVNVDDKGMELNVGDIEITDSDLILRQGESQINWPLRSLRRYGFDAELFSFECGRRCPTGPGIYAFRCSQAEQLFNQLQEAINKCTNFPLSITTLNTGQQYNQPPPLPANPPPSLTPSSVSPVHAVLELTELNPNQRGSSTNGLMTSGTPPHSYVNAIHNYVNSPIYNGSAGGDSQVSSPMPGAVDDTTARRPPTACSFPNSEHAITDINTNYAKLDGLARYYVNVNTSSKRSSSPAGPSSSRQLGVQAYPVSRFPFPPQSGSNSSKVTSLPPTTPSDIEPVNYIQLDLENSSTADGKGVHYVSTAPLTPVSKSSKGGDTVWPTGNGPSDTQLPPTPTSVVTSTTTTTTAASSTGPTRLPYAMIDFDKTEALTTTANNQRRGLSAEVS